MNHASGAMIIMMMGSALVAGCGVSSAPSAQAAQKSIPTTTPITTPATTKKASVPSPAPSQSGSHQSASVATTSTRGVALVKDWMQSGLHGEGPNMPIGDGMTIGAVQKEWGKGAFSSAGAGLYDTYSTHGVAFGVGPGDQIFDVRSFSPAIQKVTRTDVTTALGAPAAIRYADNTTLYLYLDGPNYQVLWAFGGGPGHTGNTVQHVSVFWPQGTVNLMAQTLPNPLVTVTANPTAAGSALQFSIQHAPAGYRLDELEWLPSGSRTPVVNTPSQAANNAKNHVAGNVFMTADGAYRVQFTESLNGSTGRIRLIYELPSGSAIIGTSGPITLH